MPKIGNGGLIEFKKNTISKINAVPRQKVIETPHQVSHQYSLHG